MRDASTPNPLDAGRALFASAFYPAVGIQGLGFAVRGQRKAYLTYLFSGLALLLVILVGVLTQLIHYLDSGFLFSDGNYPRTGSYIAATGGILYGILWLSGTAVEARRGRIYYPAFLSVVTPALGLLGYSKRLRGLTTKAVIFQAWGAICIVSVFAGLIALNAGTERPEAWRSLIRAGLTLYGILWAAGITTEAWWLNRHRPTRKLPEVQ